MTLVRTGHTGVARLPALLPLLALQDAHAWLGLGLGLGLGLRVRVRVRGRGRGRGRGRDKARALVAHRPLRVFDQAGEPGGHAVSVELVADLLDLIRGRGKG